MQKQQAINIVRETFENSFEKTRFVAFIRDLLNEYERDELIYKGQYIPDLFKEYVTYYERIGKYEDNEEKRIDILIVHLKRDTSIERARSMQRNFIAGYLQGNFGSTSQKDAALVAFVSPNGEDWRFSLVKLDFQLQIDEKGKAKGINQFNPAKRWSFLVGSQEKSHTAQRQFVPIMQDTDNNPTLAKLEEAFNIEKVTKEFFDAYRDLFIRTKGELDKLVKKDPRVKADFESKGIDTVNLAKKLLGQIVFLYYLQKKGWFGVPTEAAWGEGSKNFCELFEKKHGDYKNFFNDILEPLFYDALRMDRSHDDHYYRLFDCKIPFLNGGLFDPMNNYDWVKTEILLPNELFSNKNKTDEGDTGDGILDIFDRYNFTVKEDEPFEKEVAIDPELLGKAYEKFNAIRPDNYEEFLKALESGKKGEESKFNKQYGVYYTPREIVHYMCQQSLINYLHTELNPKVAYQALGDEKLDMFGNAVKAGQFELTTEHAVEEFPKDAIALLIQHGEDLREHEAQAADKKTATYSPIIAESIRKNAALIDEKLANIKVCDPAVGSGAFPVGMMSEIVRARDVLKTWSKTKKTVYDFKRECIENSLYGVDIDSGAVEIAKLRLWLSLVVDEDDPQNIKPLPNLDYKIVCGNSLVGIPEGILLDLEIKAELEEKKKKYFYITNPTKKLKVQEEIKDLFSQLVESAKQYDPSLSDIKFDFHIHFSEVFHEKSGFDVAIGNPPYVRMELIKDQKRKLQALYPDVFDGRADLFVYFYACALGLLHKNGILSFISSNKYMRAGYGEGLRRYMTQKTTIQNLLDFGDLPVFEAIAYPSIIITRKAIPSIEHKTNALKVNDIVTLEHLGDEVNTNSWIMPQIKLKPQGWALESNEILQLVEKLRSTGKPLSEVVQGKFYMGVKTGLNEAFVIDEDTRKKIISDNPKCDEIIKPWLRGRDIKRWKVDFSGLYIIFTYHGIKISDYPAVTDYLKKYKKQLEQRATSDTHPWYELQQPQMGIFSEFTKPKIVWPDIAPNPSFGYDNKGLYFGNTAYCCPTEDLTMLAILNSKVTEFFYKQTSSMIQQNFMRFIAQYVAQIPIAKPNNPKPLESLVNRILAAKGENPQADTSKEEREIDQLVYQLYGLSPEEIDIVENRA